MGHDGTWLPDGKLMLSKGREIFRAEDDGRDGRKILTVAGNPRGISLSPDGSRIRFTVALDTGALNAGGPNGGGVSSLWEARSDGTNPHPLLSPGWNVPPQECCGKWTTDGKYFVFQSTRNGLSSIWALADQSSFWRRGSLEPVQLTTGPLDFSSPVPSRDGKKLFVPASSVSSASPSGALSRAEAAHKSSAAVPLNGSSSPFRLRSPSACSPAPDSSCAASRR